DEKNIPRRPGTHTEPAMAIFFAVCSVLLVWISLFGVRFLTLTVFGWAMGLWRNPILHFIRRAESRFLFLHLLISAVVIVICWMISLNTMEPLTVLYCRDMWTVLLAVAVANGLGGAVLESVKNLCTIIVLRLGFDARKVWWDDILASLLTVALLWNLENS